MKQLFAYIRVSTAKQGQGVSLQEQRAAIERFALKAGAEITEWFEERKTAAKAGRPEFARLVKLLRRGKADGVVIHKIDRSTRNYRDWADINELIERGVDVHFANEVLDLRSRGGRLAADIQVAVAVDYIRNLREEAIKGILGRLKQGVLPCGAPLGYVDRGAGKAKTIDRVRGPLVRRLFELYATGNHSLRSLTLEARALGLRTKGRKALGIQQIQKILRNPFYVGMIRSPRHGSFQGAHKPLLKRVLFDRVQAVLDGKSVRRTRRHAFPFRRLLRCRTCGRSLVASARKGFVYYRCQTIECPTTSVREDQIESRVREILHAVTLDEAELRAAEREINASEKKEAALNQAQSSAIQEALAATSARLTRLTDLLLDNQIDAATHDEKRKILLAERQRLTHELEDLGAKDSLLSERAKRILGLAESAVSLYESGDADRRRELLRILFSDCSATGKSLEFSLREPFAAIAKRRSGKSGGPLYNTPRTFRKRRAISAKQLLAWALDFPRHLLWVVDDFLKGEEEADKAA